METIPREELTNDLSGSVETKAKVCSLMLKPLDAAEQEGTPEMGEILKKEEAIAQKSRCEGGLQQLLPRNKEGGNGGEEVQRREGKLLRANGKAFNAETETTWDVGLAMAASRQNGDETGKGKVPTRGFNQRIEKAKAKSPKIPRILLTPRQLNGETTGSRLEKRGLLTWPRL
ncbi:hypothetical protein L7F22_023377 [Adiantum nelumboides]|nr:hypothetical protein [Adiantum nelumboides]